MRTPTTLMWLAIAACSSKSAPPPPPAPPARSAKPVVPVDAAVTAAGTGSAVLPATAEDKAAGPTYRAAMKRGRTATDAKHYADAIAAFDDALVARPNEPHALAERGFAKLLAGTDLDSASLDFDHAADATTDPKLLGMIWFNRGLVDDKLGNSSAAISDYFVANEMLPSKTVAAKLEGRHACPLRVAPDQEIPTDPALDAADWLALGKAMDVLDDLGQPKTSDAARAAMFGSAAKPQLPATVVVGGMYGGTTAYVVASHAGKLRAIAVAHEAGGRCAGAVSAGAVTAVGNLVLARTLERAGGAMTPLCGEDHDTCTGSDGEDRTGTACDDTGTTVRDVVIDLASGKRVFVGEQEAPKSAAGTAVDPDDVRLVKVTLAPDGVHRTGRTCDDVIPLRTK